MVRGQKLLRIVILLTATNVLAQGSNFVLTETELSNQFRIPKSKLESQTKALSRLIEGNNQLLNECKRYASKYPELCRFVLSLEIFKDADKKDQDDGLLTFLRAPSHISPSNFARAQKSDVQDLIRVLRDYPADEVHSWLPRLLNAQTCPQNLLLASLSIYQKELPSVKAEAALEVGYKHALRCLSEQHPQFEITHQRQGLLRLMWGDEAGAQRSLKMALEVNNPKYKESTLFWLGYLEKNKRAKEVYWNTLIENYPLSFQALSAARLLNRDPYQELLKKPLIMPQRKVQDALAQLGINWLEALYMYGHNKEAMSLSYRLAKRLQHRYSRANYAYISALADKYAVTGDAMKYSQFLVNRDPALFNLQMLKFMYPKPFESTFIHIAKTIDPLLTFSVAKQESGFNPYARSPANAKGLLQILPSTAATYQPKSQKYLYDIDTNVAVGSKILSDLVQRFGKVEYALAAYNAGVSRVEAWQKRYGTSDSLLFVDIIPFQETRGYVANVLRNHYWYTSLYGQEYGVYR